MTNLTYSPRRLLRMVQVYKETQILFMAIKMNLFSYLTEFACVEKLAQELSQDAVELGKKLEFLLLAGLLEKSGEAYRNTPETEQFLNPNSTTYMGAYLSCWERGDLPQENSWQ